jgi:hypothetical protein
MSSNRSAAMMGQRSSPGRAPASFPAAAVALAAAGLALGLVIATAPAASAVPEPAGPHRAASGTWAIQHTPNPPARQGDLVGISCTSPGACTAVGHYKNFSNTVTTLAEVWNGTSWSIRKTATPVGTHESYLTSVSCTAADACTAVGFYRNSVGNVVTLAERWNGTSWSIQPTPNPGNQNNRLSGVSCTSASACTAVGFAGNFGAGSLTLAERWNGTSWSIQPTPNPQNPNHASFNSVSCTSASACTAVGTADGFVVLAEAWDGSSWSIQPTPNPAGATAGSLFGVSCPSASACFAVGNYRNGSGVHRLLAEAWNGTSWSIQPAPGPAGASRSYLNGVSCTTPSACTAVGTYQVRPGAHVTLAEAWNGSSWSVEPALNPGSARSSLNSVSCTSATACTAAGSDLSNWAVQVTMAQAWNGTSWSLQLTPDPQSFTESMLDAVACVSASACTAVGGSGTIGLAEQWDGSSWSLQRVAGPKGSSAPSLGGVSCTSATACTAVGSYNTPRGGNTLAEVWDGSSWSVRPTPNAAGFQFGFLSGVSCASASFCAAVGGSANSEAVPLAEVWNGTSWSLTPTPVPAGAINSDLIGVSCLSATACTAVGTYENSSNVFFTLAEAWNGSSWSIQPTPNPTGSTRTLLQGVACVSASACTAVGSSGDNRTLASQTLAEVWDGSSWSIQPTPNPVGNGTPVLFGVACTSASACTSVGSFQTAKGVPETLAEAWNGTSWSIQPTPNASGSTATFLTGVACTSPTACTAVGNYTFRPNNLGGASTGTLAEARS